MSKVMISNCALDGEVKVPSSKSIGHRLLICAALSNGVSRIDGLTMSKDILATMKALTALGAKFISKEEERFGRYEVHGLAYNPMINEKLTIDCSESGSTLRFLIPVGLAVNSQLIFTGEGRLVERPIDEYLPILRESGITYEYDGRLPIAFNGFLKAGQYNLSGKVSSQYTTGMLLAGPMLRGKTEIRIQGEMESQGYIDLTIEAMAKFGVVVERQGYKNFIINQPVGYRATQVEVEGDYSQGAFWIVAGLLGSHPIHIKGLKPNSTQGDAVVLELVRQMGGAFNWENEGLVVYPSRLKGMVIDASQCPDLIPIMCVLATQSEGRTSVINGSRLRVKESDRIRSTVTELSKMGADISETQEGMEIVGKTQLKGGCIIDSWNDHRIVMAASVAATLCEEPIEITGYEAVQKSYPEFFKDFASLGGRLEFIE